MLRLIALIAALLLPGLALAKPMVIKVVVLTTFESGASSAKKSGEFQAWAERYPLKHPLKVPGIEGRVLYSDDGVLGVVTGMRARPRVERVCFSRAEAWSAAARPRATLSSSIRRFI